MSVKLKYGMVGGGPGAFIGAVHRRAATMDGLAELVAGSFSSDPEKSKAQGRELGLAMDRIYGSYEEMAEQEARRSSGDRIDFVSIVTPNHLHHRIARAFALAGIHVVCDKPMTTTLEDAEDLCRTVRESGIVFALTHNYTGYPLVKQARALVSEGALGVLRRISVEYTQGWLSTALEATGQKQADWRTDPARAGAGAIGDIGSHAENLARYVTGLEMESLNAEVSSFVQGRRVDDDAAMLVRFEGGAKGTLVCSQVAVGDENRLCLRVYGTEGGLEWNQEEPNVLTVRRKDRPVETYRPGNAYLAPTAQRAIRLPAGHPEAFLEGFANIYSSAIRVMSAKLAGRAPDALDRDYPSVQDGARGVHFILSALRSGTEGGWVDMRYTPPGG